MMGVRLRRLLHPLYRRLETAVHPLRYLFLEVTSRCNLRCLHCGSDCGREAQVPFRPTSGKPVYCSDCFRSMRGA